MFQTASQAISFIKEHHIENIDLKFGLAGLPWRHVSIPASRVDEGFFDEGFSLGFEHEGAPLSLIPDPTTGFLDVVYERPTLAFLGEVRDDHSGRQSPLDTRAAAKAAADLAATRLKGEVEVGFEVGFYLFNNVRHSNRENLAFHMLESTESHGEAQDSNGPPVAAGYALTNGLAPMASPPLDKFASFRLAVIHEAAEMGVEVLAHYHGDGQSGQQVFVFAPAPAVVAADRLMLFRHLVRNLAHRQGMIASFMPLPLYPGNPGFLDTYLFLSKEGGKDGLSTARGEPNAASVRLRDSLQARVAVLSALLASSTNAFRRYLALHATGAELISLARWPTFGDRMGVRSVLADPDSDPYVTVAATIMAAVSAGKTKKRRDETHMQATLFQPSTPRLPTGMLEALDVLSESDEFLSSGSVDLRPTMAAVATSKRDQAMAVAIRPHPYEIAFHMSL